MAAPQNTPANDTSSERNDIRQLTAEALTNLKEIEKLEKPLENAAAIIQHFKSSDASIDEAGVKALLEDKDNKKNLGSATVKALEDLPLPAQIKLLNDHQKINDKYQTHHNNDTTLPKPEEMIKQDIDMYKGLSDLKSQTSDLIKSFQQTQTDKPIRDLIDVITDLDTDDDKKFGKETKKIYKEAKDIHDKYNALLEKGTASPDKEMIRENLSNAFDELVNPNIKRISKGLGASNLSEDQVADIVQHFMAGEDKDKKPKHPITQDTQTALDSHADEKKAELMGDLKDIATAIAKTDNIPDDKSALTDFIKKTVADVKADPESSLAAKLEANLPTEAKEKGRAGQALDKAQDWLKGREALVGSAALAAGVISVAAGAMGGNDQEQQNPGHPNNGQANQESKKSGWKKVAMVAGTIVAAVGAVILASKFLGKDKGNTLQPAQAGGRGA